MKNPIHEQGRAPCRLMRGLASSLLVMVAAGCTIVPEKITREEVVARVQRDQDQIYKEQEALREPVTFPVALARALKYNLDYRLRLMESALARDLFDVAKLDLLPKLVAEAGYNHRNNDSGGTSIGIEDRQVSLRPSTSEERSYYMARAEFSWNALDFGLSYYRAKQTADEYNIAEERRRKILQNIVQDVRNAYWRAVGAQRLVGEAESLLARIRQALERSREAERAGVLPPGQALAYQRALLDAMTLVNLKRQEMEFAKRELAALMSVTPGTDFRLAAVDERALPDVPVNIGELELLALESRPELREEDYRARIGQNEARRQLAALFPNLNLFAGTRYHSNTYLYNSNWSETGANLSINLLRLTGLPTIRKTNEAREKADEARRLA
ncbi:MAG: TolC family protein, partial [Burkholderiales bacterium]|nr:TolC family protein [Burkholderiales bacterium]